MAGWSIPSPTPTWPPAWTSCTSTSGYSDPRLHPIHTRTRSCRMTMARIVALVLAAGLTAAPPAFAQISDGIIKIGVLNDQSSLYADLGGPGSVLAARMAVEDFGAEKKGMKVEIISADHQNKPDVGSQI